MVENEGIMITSDYNFIDVDFFVEYRISEPVKYLYTSEQPEEILKNIVPHTVSDWKSLDRGIYLMHLLYKRDFEM